MNGTGRTLKTEPGFQGFRKQLTPRCQSHPAEHLGPWLHFATRDDEKRANLSDHLESLVDRLGGIAGRRRPWTPPPEQEEEEEEEEAASGAAWPGPGAQPPPKTVERTTNPWHPLHGSPAGQAKPEPGQGSLHRDPPRKWPGQAQECSVEAPWCEARSDWIHSPWRDRRCHHPSAVSSGNRRRDLALLRPLHLPEQMVHAAYFPPLFPGDKHRRVIMDAEVFSQ